MADGLAPPPADRIAAEADVARASLLPPLESREFAVAEASPRCGSPRITDAVRRQPRNSALYARRRLQRTGGRLRGDFRSRSPRWAADPHGSLKPAELDAAVLLSFETAVMTVARGCWPDRRRPLGRG